MEIPTDRRTLRAELDSVETGEQELPRLEAAVTAARMKRDEVVAQYEGELRLAYGAYRERTDSLARRRTRAENGLRGTAPRLVTDRGPVVEALKADVWHLRVHGGGVAIQSDRELVRDTKGANPADKNVRAAVEGARLRVQHADAADTLVPAFEDALEAVRELQLEVAPQLPGALQEILGALPARCACCGEAFRFTTATEAET